MAILEEDRIFIRVATHGDIRLVLDLMWRSMCMQLDSKKFLKVISIRYRNSYLETPQ